MAILNLYSGCCVICLQQDRLLFPRQRAQRKDLSELNYYCVYIAKPTNDGADCWHKFYEGRFHSRRVFTVSYISFRILAMFKF